MTQTSDRPNLNPFTAPLRQAEDRMAHLTAQGQDALEALDWYEAADRPVIEGSLHDCVSHKQDLDAELESTRMAIAGNQKETESFSSQLRTRLNPKNWFAADQRQLRRKLRALPQERSRYKKRADELVTKITKAQQSIEKLREWLRVYDAFDPDGCRREIRDNRDAIAQWHVEVERLTERHKAVHCALGPLIKQMQDLLARRRRAEAELRYAEELESGLDEAANSYERAMIHEECEEKFGNGSPRRVISVRRREVRQAERDLKKFEARIQETAKRASLDVHAIVIDGNNLCYEGGVFIGLKALEALVPELVQDMSVTLVFDSQIRQMLRCSDAAIKRRFPCEAVVHVVATKQHADETILHLALEDACTYILSNDRFGEFVNEPAVRDGRVLRHELVDGHAMIHDLSIGVGYARS